jgi:flagellar biosynthesis protein FliP
LKIFIRVLVFIVLGMLSIGFYMQYKEMPQAEKIIGIGVLLIVLVLLPAFLYHRYQNKNLQDYILDKEKWEQVKENFKKNM